MNELDLLARKYGTDKRTNDPNTDPKYHGYTPIYSDLFSPIRYSCKSLLEIGVREGWSHQMWYDYFPNAMIYGLDMFMEISRENVKIENERIKLFEGDQSDSEMLERTFKDFEFDIIIDDGSHYCKHHQISFKHLFLKVKPSGYYIIEDLATCYEPQFNDNYDLKYSTISFLKRLQNKKFMSYYIDNGKEYLDQIESVTINGELGVIKKK